ncbi:MAG: hypothetical protein ABS939_22820, partial [Psychrobacillus sp.]
KISSDDIKNPDLKKQAKKFLNNLTKELLKVIDEAVRQHNPVDGKINTSDILYTMELDFKENLAESFGTIKIKNGRNIVTSDEGKNSETTPSKVKRKKKEKEGEAKQKQTGIRRKSKSLDKGNQDNSVDDVKDEFKINPYRVERLLINDQEIIQLNLTGDPDVSKSKKCNLKFNIVDGMGKEYMGEFDMQANYSKVVDINSGSECKVVKDAIKHVTIKNGYVNLQLALQPLYNRSLKFIYYVEV